MDNIVCKICKKEYKHLGSHIVKGHHMTAREYKQQFELDYNYPLISKEVKEKKQRAFNKRREYYLKNLKEGSKKYQFKKGKVYRKRISLQSRKRYLKQLSKFDTLGTCPICKMKYKHVQSHLYMKHKIILVDNIHN